MNEQYSRVLGLKYLLRNCPGYRIAQFAVPNIANFFDDTLMCGNGTTFWGEVLSKAQCHCLHGLYRLKTEAYGIKVFTNLLLQPIRLLEALGKLTG